MSTPAQAQVAILVAPGSRSERWTPPAVPGSEPYGRSSVTLAAFGGLALYGALSWGALLTGAAGGRLAALVAVAVALAAGGPWLRAHSRILAFAASGAAALVMLAICGVPLAWLAHPRIAVCVRWIGGALAELPQVLVPYGGGDRAVRAMIFLGPAVLLLAAALPLAFASRPLRARPRVATAFPLLVLAAVPSTLLRPAHPYLEGLLLFALLLVLVAGERLPRPAVPLAAVLAGAAGAAAMVLAPGLDTQRPWVDFQALAGRLSAGTVEQFDFAQGFGPLQWPRSGREVFDVRAARPDYWKVEDLDLFDGRGFVPGLAPSAPLPEPDAAIRRRFTQTVSVSIRSLQSSEVIAAGSAESPPHMARVAQPGLAPGTWNVSVPLRPGDSYSVTTYSPQPAAAELASAGSNYPAVALAPYRSMLLPSDIAGAGSTAIVFEPFHHGQTAGLAGSPYGQAYGLAQRLAVQAPTPYAYVQGVMAWLHSGYAYSESPPPATFPLLSFLFSSHRGYCQQFAGAMALLLRMGGLPARVVGGFTPGTLDSASHQWVVTDIDAHDWVEVWFPHFGWVRFDPTPGAAPARSGAALPPGVRARPDHGAPTFRQRHRASPVPRNAGRTLAAPQRRDSGGAFSPALLALVSLLMVGGAATGAVLARRGAAAGLVEELGRALRRSGRPAAGGVTLAALERRLRHSPDAAAYVRCLRARRYGAVEASPTPRQRRALRAALRDGLGPLGRLRALWALPPRRLPRS